MDMEDFSENLEIKKSKDCTQVGDNIGYSSTQEISARDSEWSGCPVFIQHPDHRSELDKKHHYLGLDIGTDVEGQHVISAICEGGLINMWLKQSGSQALRPGDIIIEFNNLSVEEWSRESLVSQFTAVEKKWTLSLKRKDGKKWIYRMLKFKLIVNGDDTLSLDITEGRYLYEKGTYITDVKHYEIHSKWVYIMTGRGNDSLKFDGGKLVIGALNKTDDKFRFYVMFYNGTDQDPKDAGDIVYLCQIGNVMKNRFVCVLTTSRVGMQATSPYKVKNDCIRKPDPKLFKQHRGPNRSVFLESLIQPDHYLAVRDDEVFLKHKKDSIVQHRDSYLNDPDVCLQFFFDEPDSIHA